MKGITWWNNKMLSTRNFRVKKHLYNIIKILIFSSLLLNLFTHKGHWTFVLIFGVSKLQNARKKLIQIHLDIRSSNKAPSFTFKSTLTMWEIHRSRSILSIKKEHNTFISPFYTLSCAHTSKKPNKKYVKSSWSMILDELRFEIKTLFFLLLLLSLSTFFFFVSKIAFIEQILSTRVRHG